MMRNGFLASLLIFSGMLAHALDMEYISPAQKAELELQFEKAEVSSKDFAALKLKKWTCDMYGVRTRLQVKRGLKLYEWNQENWHNEGSQIVRDYTFSDVGLTGKNGPIEDQVKVNPKGQLISRLSVLRPDRQVVAYAVCDTP